MSTQDKIHFCTCNDTKCPLHPTNHNKGCDLCIAKNLKKKEIPTCLFKMINADISNVEKFDLKSFVDFYLKQTNN